MSGSTFLGGPDLAYTCGTTVLWIMLTPCAVYIRILICTLLVENVENLFADKFILEVLGD